MSDQPQTSKDYIDFVMEVKSSDFHSPDPDLLHAAMGIATEAGETMDVLKKAIYYGKPIDQTHLQEELGDLLWYIGLACHCLGVDFETLMSQNMRKLRTRYGAKFSHDAALHRNLEAERSVLEQR